MQPSVFFEYNSKKVRDVGIVQFIGYCRVVYLVAAITIEKQ